MQRPTPRCADCGTALIEGEVLYTPNGAAHFSVEWLEKEPRPGPMESHIPSSRFRRRIASFRCPECGLLKDYAS